MPAETPRAVATSLTVWPIGPGASWDSATGRIPAPLTRPTVGFSATRPALLDGREHLGGFRRGLHADRQRREASGHGRGRASRGAPMGLAGGDQFTATFGLTVG